MPARARRRRVAATARQQQLTALHELLQELLRDFPGLREKPLWGGLTYRYGERVFFVLTRRARSVLLEMKLADAEADLALRLPYVHPYSFTRLARTGWVAISLTPETPIHRVRTLVEQSYDGRIEQRRASRGQHP